MSNLSGRGPLGLKPAKEKAHPLRENARGQHCTLRLPGCRGDTVHTVLAHLRRFGWGAAASKPHDLLAVFACDRCHAKQESHHPDCTDADLLRALGETLMAQHKSGLIIVEKGPDA